jgi:hypothetical protein
MLVYGGKRDKPETDNLKAVGIKKSYLLKYFMVCSQGNERGLEPVQGFHALIAGFFVEHGMETGEITHHEKVALHPAENGVDVGINERKIKLSTLFCPVKRKLPLFIAGKTATDNDHRDGEQDKYKNEFAAQTGQHGILVYCIFYKGSRK